jgi:hypothetical protein
MEKVIGMINQNVQDGLKKFQGTKNKKLWRLRNK